jgi:hypothetical protein
MYMAVIALLPSSDYYPTYLHPPSRLCVLKKTMGQVCALLLSNSVVIIQPHQEASRKQWARSLHYHLTVLLCNPTQLPAHAAARVLRISATINLERVSADLDFDQRYIPIETQYFSENQDQNHADKNPRLLHV